MIYGGAKDPEHKEMVQEHLKALDRANIFEPRVHETGKTYSAEEIEAKRQERMRRNGR